MKKDNYRKNIIDVIAPASAITNLDIIDKIKHVTSKLGYITRIPTDIVRTKNYMFEKGFDPFCANSDEIRSKYLKNALQANDSEIIWALRGGYGCSRLISYLEQLPKPKYKKILIGFSDISALHIFFQNKWDWPSIHANNIAACVEGDLKYIENILEIINNDQEIIYHNFKALNRYATISKEIEAKTIGGNLCVIESSVGTNWQIDAKGKILFLEEIGERGYRVDRSFEHLIQAGILNGVKAVILGEFTPGYESDGNNYIDYAIKRFALNCDEMHIPVISSQDFGHNDINFPLYFGVKSKLKLAEEIILLNNI